MWFSPIKSDMPGRMMPSKPEPMFRSNRQLERKSSVKRVQLEIKVNISFKLKEIEPVVPYSQSISLRLNSPTREKTEARNFTSAIYLNPKLIEKINQFQPKLHVDLSNSHLIDADMTIIADQVIREKKCTELWLYGNQITCNGVEIISLSLRQNSTLKYLDLSHNQISDRGVRALTEALLPEQNSSLTTLQLSKNMISNEGAKYLAEMLRRNQTITELWLSRNEISQEGIEQLANALADNNRTLKSLSLSMNILLTDLCIDSLIEMMEHNQTLKSLWINGCNFTEQGKMRLHKVANRKKNFRMEL